MTRRIRTTRPTVNTIRDTSPCLPRVEPSQVAAALGAEPAAVSLDAALAPITLFAVREELVKRLQSSGGRPALAGTTRRAKIPLSDEEWLQLEELAATISSPGFAPSAGQVASVLLTLSVQAVSSRLGESEGEASSSLTRELAARTLAESAPNLPGDRPPETKP
jgi:hypothetical protein